MAEEKKLGRGARIAKYFRDLKGEFKKVVWPTIPATVRNTLVTLAMCVVLGVLICAIDIGLSALVDLLVQV